MQVLVDGVVGGCLVLDVEKELTGEELSEIIFTRLVENKLGEKACYKKWKQGVRIVGKGGLPVRKVEKHVSLIGRGLGGIDFQNRAGSKPGSGGLASSEQASLDRKERLRKLALESVDLNKDPYFMRNHVGSFECKLCLTLHNTEANYLAHTQGKRHQQNLARRALKQASSGGTAQIQTGGEDKTYVEQVRTSYIKIGRPGYKVTKSRDPTTNQRTLLFEIDYQQADADIVQPRHRFMSAFEQRLEPPDKNYQYILFACEPYETIGFKIPNDEIDKHPDRFYSNWHTPTRRFSLSLQFLDKQVPEDASSSADAPTKKHRPTLHFNKAY